MAIRVAHVGTGNVGRLALTELVTNPQFELTGLCVSTPEKVGKDAGALAGVDVATGIAAVNDLEAVIATRPECIEVLFSELAKTAGQDPRLDAHVEKLRPQLEDLETIQYRARKVAEDICLALQGSLLVRHGHPAVAEAFSATRLGREWGGAFGTMPSGLDLAPILERAMIKG